MTTSEREREIRDLAQDDHQHDFSVHTVRFLLAQLDEARALAEFWEREVNNFRRNAAFRADQMADEKIRHTRDALRELHRVVKGSLQGYGILEPAMVEAERVLKEGK